MKIIFAGETKRVPEFKSFEDIVNYSHSIFKSDMSAESTHHDLKLFYMDEDNDIISVDCQSDFDLALQSNSAKVKFVFAE